MTREHRASLFGIAPRKQATSRDHRPGRVARSRRSAAIAVTVADPLRIYLPVALMLGLAIASRTLARRYLARQLGVPVHALPAPWNGAVETT